MTPMLAYNGEWSFDDLPIPCAVTPKIDGVRAVTTSNGPRTRSGKEIPNLYLRELLASLPPRLDGEVVTFTNGKMDNFHIASGKIRQHENLYDFRYFIFDCITTLPYEERIRQVLKLELPVWCEVLIPTLCYDEDDVRINHEDFVSQGFEGTIIRDPNSVYKHGRATLAEATMFKLVDWNREEGKFRGITENDSHNDRIGAMIVDHPKWGEIHLGSGFSLDVSRMLRINWQHFVGKDVTFKYRAERSLNKPSIPIFVGFRMEGDK